MRNVILILTLALVALFACMKAPELKPDFGPEVTDENFAATVKPEPPDFKTVKANEYAYATRETWVEGRPYALNNRWAFTITAQSELVDRYQISVVHELHEYSAGVEKVSSNKGDFAFAKEVAPPSTSSATAAQYPSEESARRALADISPMHPNAVRTSLNFSPLALMNKASIRALANTPRVTIHNLRFNKGNYPIPEFVHQRTDCGGLSAEKCQSSIRAFYLSFDQVNWEENGGQKYTMTRVFSSDVPFFASTLSPLIMSKDYRYFYPGIVQACVKTDLPYNGVTIQVTQCDEIKDFTFGH